MQHTTLRPRSVDGLRSMLRSGCHIWVLHAPAKRPGNTRTPGRGSKRHRRPRLLKVGAKDREEIFVADLILNDE